MNIYTQTPAFATETATDSTAPQAQSWRDTLPIHPAALLLPRMSCDELQELGRDIRKNGLRFSIALWQPDKGASALLLDGISRLDAVEVELGRPVRVVLRTYRSRTWWSLETDEDGESVPVTDLIGEAGNTTADQQTFILLGRDVDPWAYVISANLHRRHLTAEQKRDLIAKLIKATPEKSDRQIAETVKASPTTVGTVRAEMEATGDVSKLDTRTDSKGRAQPATKPSRERYTPEVIMQIMNLLERGASREDIATTIGVTTGSLQSACWRLGISLRRKATTTRTPPPPEDTRDNIGPASSGEIARLNARIDELQADKRRLETENIGLRSEVEETKAARKPEGEGEGSELRNLLRAWHRASQGTREKFKARVGLVAVEPPAKVMDDGLDIPEYLRRPAP
jgi:hypothetical protein